MIDYPFRLTFPSLFKETLEKHGNCNAYAFAGEKPRTYKMVSDEINALIAFLEKSGIRPQDKVAIFSTNMPNWGCVYFAITFMGAVVVPILPDFSNTEVGNVLDHSESKAVFVSTGLLQKIGNHKTEIIKM